MQPALWSCCTCNDHWRSNKVVYASSFLACMRPVCLRLASGCYAAQWTCVLLVQPVGSSIQDPKYQHGSHEGQGNHLPDSKIMRPSKKAQWLKVGGHYLQQQKGRSSVSPPVLLGSLDPFRSCVLRAVVFIEQAVRAQHADSYIVGTASSAPVLGLLVGSAALCSQLVSSTDSHTSIQSGPLLQYVVCGPAVAYTHSEFVGHVLFLRSRLCVVADQHTQGAHPPRTPVPTRGYASPRLQH